MRDIYIDVLSREQAEAYVPKKNEVCISICSYTPNDMGFHDSGRKPVLSDKFDDVLYLAFDDIQPTVYECHREAVESGDMKAMSDEQAVAVAQFVAKYFNTKMKLIIHCYAGISRSRSIAAAIADKFHMKDRFQAYNKYVYEKVLEQLRNVA